MEHKAIPTHLVMGMLGAGKTTWLKELIAGCKAERILYICCEEGEETLPETFSGPYKVNEDTIPKQYRMDPDSFPEQRCMAADSAPGQRCIIVETIEYSEDFIAPELTALADIAMPDEIFIECNGMWSYGTIGCGLPHFFNVTDIRAVFDAASYQLYLKNMGSLILEKIRAANMIRFRGVTESLKEMLQKQNLRLLNKNASVELMDEKGCVNAYQSEGFSFSESGNVIEVSESLYPYWYTDAAEVPARYEGKLLSFTGVLGHAPNLPDGCCTIGQTFMFCCPQDAVFLGVLCRGTGHEALENGTRVSVCGRFLTENDPALPAFSLQIETLSVLL